LVNDSSIGPVYFWRNNQLMQGKSQQKRNKYMAIQINGTKRHKKRY